MWFDPLALIVRKCGAVGAWLICLIVAASCFGWPIVTATFSTSVIRYAAAGCDHLGVIGRSRGIHQPDATRRTAIILDSTQSASLRSLG
jgi:hypothetical protein